MYTVRREYNFSAAHRIKGHPKCGRLHGHNYHVWVTIGAFDLDTEGMVMDFGIMDTYINPIIEEMDHKYLKADGETFLWTFPGDVFAFPYDITTAENIAHYICMKLRSHIDLPLIKVEVSETKRGIASYVSSK